MKKQLAIENRKPRICFVAHNAYGALAGINTGHMGGIETQTSMMARWLAQKGYQVSMITWDEGQENDVVVGGVRVIKMCAGDAGIKGLRFLYPKWTSLCQAMRRANADIYYYNCGDLGLGQVAMWARRNHRKCVYSVANDPDCDPALPVLKPLRERLLYRYGLKHADSVIVQTRNQQRMLNAGFGIDSTVIPMPSEGFDVATTVSVEDLSQKKPIVFWVGRISREKRLEWLLDVAERCPQITFRVIGAANSDSDYASILIRRAAGMHNVKMHGRILHANMVSYFQHCRILCCTSAYEGFPNTFLEAWSLGIPLVSTFDPDGVIASNGLGWVAQDIEGIVACLRKAIQSPKLWSKASIAARQYYLANHTPEVSLPRFERLFLKVAGYHS